jgi:hypothetical protein
VEDLLDLLLAPIAVDIHFQHAGLGMNQPSNRNKKKKKNECSENRHAHTWLSRSARRRKIRAERTHLHLEHVLLAHLRVGLTTHLTQRCSPQPAIAEQAASHLVRKRWDQRGEKNTNRNREQQQHFPAAGVCVWVWGCRRRRLSFSSARA